MGGAVGEKGRELHLEAAVELAENIVLQVIEQHGPPPLEAPVAIFLPQLFEDSPDGRPVEAVAQHEKAELEHGLSGQLFGPGRFLDLLANDIVKRLEKRRVSLAFHVPGVGQ